jgi:predicted metal-binding protein
MTKDHLMTAKSRLNICITCTASNAEGRTDPRHGQQLFDKMEKLCAERDLPFDLRPVECLTNCTSGCSVALNGAGKWGYVYGNVDPDQMIDDLAELAGKYAESEKGIVAWRERPETLRRNVIARIPPLD